ILRSIIQENLPPALRVSVLVSGHLSVELGGPILMDKAVDAEFDRRVLHLLRSGDVEGLLAETSYQKMVQAGNFSSGVLDYVLALGMAGGKSATQAEGVFTTINTHAFLLWDLEEGSPA
ncbi:MAG TPA: hypothetical protein VNL15_00315, partial [Dehalococcoidia bacterium]|nr:hypothetical protein [Dehalococcoidia bacterium]